MFMSEDTSHNTNAQPDYSRVMQTYKSLEKAGLKAEADAVMSNISGKYTADHPASPEEIQHGLEAILKKHDSNHPSAPHGSHAAHTKTASKATRWDGLVGLAAVVAIIALASSGMPAYMPLPVY